MISRKVSLAIVVVICSLSLYAAASKPNPTVATILCYHIVQSPIDTKFSITRETFEQQISYLTSAGYNVVSFADMADFLAGRRKSLPRNAVVITVDDGWKCTYTEMFPVMKRHHLPFTVFVYPKFIGQSGYALNWKQIREMSDEGVDIQSHSYSHPFLTQRRHRALDDGQYSDWLAYELKQSKKAIEEKTGKPVRYLAYPYGDFDSRVVQSAIDSGYDAAVIAGFGPVRADSDRYRLRRLVVDTKISFADFRRYLGNGPLKLTSTSPASGTLLNPQRPVVAAKLADFHSIDPSSVGITVLGLGASPFSYNPSDGTVSLVVREAFKSNRQQALVWGRELATGRRVEATWTFYGTEMPSKPLPRTVPLTPPEGPPGEPEASEPPITIPMPPPPR